MFEDRPRSLKWQRHEVKYLVTERQALDIASYCRDYLPPDPYSAVPAGGSYPVLSVYLDSASHELLRQTLSKVPQRFKLRARSYVHFSSASADTSSFLEIKRRIQGVMHKTRARVDPCAARSLIWNGTEVVGEEEAGDPRTAANINEFLQLRSQVRANPALGVFYEREAYESSSAERVRITLDRNLHFGVLGPPDNGGVDMWWQVDPGGVILEVKFTNTYPFWVANMLRRFEVVRRGICKYALCSRAAGVRLPEDGG